MPIFAVVPATADVSHCVDPSPLQPGTERFVRRLRNVLQDLQVIQRRQNVLEPDVSRFWLAGDDNFHPAITHPGM